MFDANKRYNTRCVHIIFIYIYIYAHMVCIDFKKTVSCVNLALKRIIYLPNPNESPIH